MLTRSVEKKSVRVTDSVVEDSHTGFAGVDADVRPGAAPGVRDAFARSNSSYPNNARLLTGSEARPTLPHAHTLTHARALDAGVGHPISLGGNPHGSYRAPPPRFTPQVCLYVRLCISERNGLILLISLLAAAQVLL